MSRKGGNGDGARHVTVDVGPAVHQRAGLSRYAERLTYHLHQEHSPQVALTLFYNAHSGHTVPASLASLPSRSVALGQYAWRLGALASQLLHCPLFERRLPAGQIYHATEHLLPRLRRATVLTVHDLIFERLPQHHTWTNRAFLRLGMPFFVRAAHAIIAVSHATRADLIDRYPASRAKVQVIYQGIDGRFAPASAEAVARIRDRYSPERPYLLMVGTLEPRKNHETALRALLRLKALGQPHRLLIAGGRGWLFEPIQALVGQLALSEDVTFAGFVEEADLPALYSGADCLLLPSIYEGFGFPVLEAMACDTPVVCSPVSSLAEVTGDAALQVEPTDDAALATAVSRILNEPLLAAELRRRGRAQAARFSWTQCAAETAALYAAL